MYKFEAKYVNMETGDESYLPIEIDLSSIGCDCDSDSLLTAWKCALSRAYSACESFQSLDSIQFICC